MKKSAGLLVLLLVLSANSFAQQIIDSDRRDLAKPRAEKNATDNIEVRLIDVFNERGAQPFFPPGRPGSLFTSDGRFAVSGSGSGSGSTGGPNTPVLSGNCTPDTISGPQSPAIFIANDGSECRLLPQSGINQIPGFSELVSVNPLVPQTRDQVRVNSISLQDFVLQGTASSGISGQREAVNTSVSRTFNHRTDGFSVTLTFTVGLDSNDNAVLTGVNFTRTPPISLPTPPPPPTPPPATDFDCTPTAIVGPAVPAIFIANNGSECRLLPQSGLTQLPGFSELIAAQTRNAPAGQVTVEFLNLQEYTRPGDAAGSFVTQNVANGTEVTATFNHNTANFSVTLTFTVDRVTGGVQIRAASFRRNGQ